MITAARRRPAPRHPARRAQRRSYVNCPAAQPGPQPQPHSDPRPRPSEARSAGAARALRHVPPHPAGRGACRAIPPCAPHSAPSTTASGMRAGALTEFVLHMAASPGLSFRDREPRTQRNDIPRVATVDQPGGGAWAGLPSSRAATWRRMREGGGASARKATCTIERLGFSCRRHGCWARSIRPRVRQTLANGHFPSSAPSASIAVVGGELIFGKAA